MNAAIFSFNRPTKRGAVPSSMVAQRMSQVLKIPHYYDPADMPAVKVWDVLFLINGSVGFSTHLETLAPMILKARRVVWVQTDYTNAIPLSNGNAQSPFRRAFVERVEKGRPEMDVWTSVFCNQERTPLSALINWNLVAAPPAAAMLPPKPAKALTLHYYGYFRPERIRSFDKYFVNVPGVEVRVNTPSEAKYKTRYPHITVDPTMPMHTADGPAILNAQAFGIYLTDKETPKSAAFPYQRFYEVISSGTALLFEPEACIPAKTMGFDASPYVLHDTADLPTWTRKRSRIIKEQQEWYRQQPFAKMLNGQLQRAWRKLCGAL
jgi:hypothetical protein